MNPRQRLRDIAHRAMRARGLDPDFSSAVLSEARSIPGPAAAPAVRDLRDRLWCSIDNDDSRDLDQLTVAEAQADGSTRVLIAIADVEVLVGKGSAIDGYARTNTTSVYTAAQVFPMLPERLSTDLTSLNPGEPRLAVVVEIQVKDGAVEGSQIYRATVFNHAKLAYNALAAWL